MEIPPETLEGKPSRCVNLSLNGSSVSSLDQTHLFCIVFLVTLLTFCVFFCSVAGALHVSCSRLSVSIVTAYTGNSACVLPSVCFSFELPNIKTSCTCSHLLFCAHAKCEHLNMYCRLNIYCHWTGSCAVHFFLLDCVDNFWFFFCLFSAMFLLNYTNISGTFTPLVSAPRFILTLVACWLSVWLRSWQIKCLNPLHSKPLIHLYFPDDRFC